MFANWSSNRVQPWSLRFLTVNRKNVDTVRPTTYFLIFFLYNFRLSKKLLLSTVFKYWPWYDSIYNFRRLILLAWMTTCFISKLLFSFLWHQCIMYPRLSGLCGCREITARASLARLPWRHGRHTRGSTCASAINTISFPVFAGQIFTQHDLKPIISSPYHHLISPRVALVPIREPDLPKWPPFSPHSRHREATRAACRAIAPSLRPSLPATPRCVSFLGPFALAIISPFYILSL